ncbi:hypothetical protein [Bosea sp. (in: a-proteobacteria)]|uniref:hypothetical protein n=1 Tax=Bosea sp. (in: a-proteobacteria) TaxID=1871050 RepID=UPI001AC48E01|nr:hypothetical protein [Bosea sp. (in: a-proteobacteria)]MBN9440614.1 hypothetical protein [Bosea sp. (in: a-proteobacteria)]
MRVKPSFIVFAGLAAISATARPAAAEDCAAPEETRKVRLASLERHGDLVLEDGSLLRLAGLAPRQDEAERERFAAALRPWLGQGFELVALGGTDRWGRVPARLLLPDGPAGDIAGHDLAALLLAAGAALHLPEPGLAGCNALWRAAEAGRSAKTVAERAVSATPATNLALAGLPVIDGHDPAAMRAQAGRIVLVEGRIAAVGERARRTYLNFTRRRGAGGSIVLSRALWRELQSVGWTASALTGKRVRVRGVIEGRDGLLVTIETRAALEMVD